MLKPGDMFVVSTNGFKFFIEFPEFPPTLGNVSSLKAGSILLVVAVPVNVQYVLVFGDGQVGYSSFFRLCDTLYAHRINT